MHIITDTVELKNLLDNLGKQQSVAIDVEFIRQTTYYPQLCLIQMAFADSNPILIDPKNCDITLLIPLLTDPTLLKILHDGKQDIETIKHALNIVINPIFDTQIAAAFCELNAQISYEKLVQALINPNFKQIKTPLDWGRRPLPDSYLQYAAEDVIHLHSILHKLTEILHSKNKYDWFWQDMSAFNAMAIYEPSDYEIGMRFKVGHLHPKHHANARTLSVIRNRIAMQLNIPKRRVISDEALITNIINNNVQNLFTSHPDLMTDIEELKALFKPYAQPSNQDIETANIRTLIFSAIVKDKAQTFNIPDSIIANKEQIRTFNNQDDNPLKHGWRYDVVGNTLEKVLNGTVAIKIDPDKLQYLQIKK